MPESYDKLNDNMHDQYAEITSQLAVIVTTLGIVRNPLPSQHIVHTEAEFSVQQGRDQVK